MSMFSKPRLSINTNKRLPETVAGLSFLSVNANTQEFSCPPESELITGSIRISESTL